jgi:adenylate kinase family enzyme
MNRIVIIGNSGSGKTTVGDHLANDFALPHLDLDSLAWESPGVRRPLEESIAMIHAFVDASQEWIVEGCYAGLLESILPFATELRFLNPGIDACVRNCLARPFEAHKYASMEEQNARLEFLLSGCGTMRCEKMSTHSPRTVTSSTRLQDENASTLIRTAMGMRGHGELAPGSVRAKSNHGIDARRSARWNVASGESHSE